MCEDTNVVISLKSKKNRQYNDQKCEDTNVVISLKSKKNRPMTKSVKILMW